jgi:hypothetical protein
MAGYATPTQVYALNTGRNFTATSKPNIAQVQQFIDQTAGVIDGILAEKAYTLPLATSATAARVSIEFYNALGAACLVERSAPTSDERRQEACEMWRNAQDMLRSGAVEFPDLERSTSTDMPRSSFPATPMFTRDMEF